MPLPWQLADVSKLEPAIAAAKRAGASKNLVAAAEVRLQEANPMYPRLQPYVSRLQPYVSQAATLCIPGCNPLYPRRAWRRRELRRSGRRRRRERR